MNLDIWAPKLSNKVNGYSIGMGPSMYNKGVEHLFIKGFAISEYIMIGDDSDDERRHNNSKPWKKFVQ